MEFVSVTEPAIASRCPTHRGRWSGCRGGWRSTPTSTIGMKVVHCSVFLSEPRWQDGASATGSRLEGPLVGVEQAWRHITVALRRFQWLCISRWYIGYNDKWPFGSIQWKMNSACEKKNFLFEPSIQFYFFTYWICWLTSWDNRITVIAGKMSLYTDIRDAFKLTLQRKTTGALLSTATRKQVLRRNVQMLIVVLLCCPSPSTNHLHYRQIVLFI